MPKTVERRRERPAGSILTTSELTPENLGTRFDVEVHSVPKSNDRLLKARTTYQNPNPDLKESDDKRLVFAVEVVVDEPENKSPRRWATQILKPGDSVTMEFSLPERWRGKPIGVNFYCQNHWMCQHTIDLQ